MWAGGVGQVWAERVKNVGRGGRLGMRTGIRICDIDRCEKAGNTKLPGKYLVRREQGVSHQTICTWRASGLQGRKKNG